MRKVHLINCCRCYTKWREKWHAAGKWANKRSAKRKDKTGTFYRSCQLSHVSSFIAFHIRLKRNEFNESWSIFEAHYGIILIRVCFRAARARASLRFFDEFFVWWIFFQSIFVKCSFTFNCFHITITCKVQNRFEQQKARLFHFNQHNWTKCTCRHGRLFISWPKFIQSKFSLSTACFRLLTFPILLWWDREKKMHKL